MGKYLLTTIFQFFLIGWTMGLNPSKAREIMLETGANHLQCGTYRITGRFMMGAGGRDRMAIFPGTNRETHMPLLRMPTSYSLGSDRSLMTLLVRYPQSKGERKGYLYYMERAKKTDWEALVHDPVLKVDGNCDLPPLK